MKMYQKQLNSGGRVEIPLSSEEYRLNNVTLIPVSIRHNNI